MGRTLTLLICLGIVLLAVGVGLSLPLRATTDTGEVHVAGTCGPPMLWLVGNAPEIQDIGEVSGTDIGFDVEPGRLEQACRRGAQRRLLAGIVVGLVAAGISILVARSLRPEFSSV